MTEMRGSIPVFSFTLPLDRDVSIAGGNLDIARKITKRLNALEYEWYKDFRYTIESETKGILFEVFNETLVPIIKELIVEYKI
jgi:hypothetical protein